MQVPVFGRVRYVSTVNDEGQGLRFVNAEKTEDANHGYK